MFFDTILGVLHYVVAAEHVDILILALVVVSSATELCHVVKIIRVVGDLTLFIAPKLVTDIPATIFLLTEAPFRSVWWGGFAILVFVTNKGCGRVREAATIDLDDRICIITNTDPILTERVLGTGSYTRVLVSPLCIVLLVLHKTLPDEFLVVPVLLVDLEGQLGACLVRVSTPNMHRTVAYPEWFWKCLVLGIFPKHRHTA